jgi:ABC-type multidrug transport system fused ATPase/permease subunit|nr:MAG TPA: hypothetical protein [Caudoviricetes sp.]
MKFTDIANWSSIISLIISLLTLFTTFRVNKKINAALREQQDSTFFNNKVANNIKNLEIIKTFAEKDDYQNSFGTKQYSQVKLAMELVNSSWNILLVHEGKLVKLYKRKSWKKEFKNISKMYNDECKRDCKLLVDFLNQFIIFLEKERENVR